MWKVYSDRIIQGLQRYFLRDLCISPIENL